MSRRTSSNIRKSSDDAASPKSKYNVKKSESLMITLSSYLPSIGVTALIVFLASFGYIIYQKSQDRIQNLMNIDTYRLNETLSFRQYNSFNSEPYLFYCDRERPYSANKKKDNAVETVPQIFSQLNLQKTPVKINFAVLNCSQSVIANPSDSPKSIYDKFKLKKDIKPLIWGKTPWNNHYYRNIQMSAIYMKDVGMMRKFLETYMSPHAISIDTNKAFIKYCQFHKASTHDENDIPSTCVLILKGDRYQAKLHGSLEQRLVQAFPATRFGVVDANKLRLSFEDFNVLTTDTFGIKLYALRNGTHFLEMLNPPTWDYIDTFISHAVSVPISDYKKITNQKAITLVKPKAGGGRSTYSKKAPKEPKKKESVDADDQESGRRTKASKSSASSSTKSKSKAKEESVQEEEQEDDEVDDQEEVQSPEKIKMEQAERERKIREQMDRQQREHLYDSTESEEEMSSSTGEDDEDVESVIEL
jgi:hypothetical protein